MGQLLRFSSTHCFVFGRQTKGVYSPDLLQVADQNLMSLLQYGEKFLRDKIFADFAVGLTSAKIKFANFYKSTQ